MFSNLIKSLNAKTSWKKYWTRENISFTFLIILPLVVLMWDSYYTCNIIRDVNPWILKCRWKVNSFCDNHVITCWPKIYILEAFIILKTVNFMQFSSNTIFRWYTCRKFYMVKFSYFGGKSSKVKKKFWKMF